jgi:hypothetical protein
MFSGKKGSESGSGSSGQDGEQSQQLQQLAPQSDQQPAEQPQPAEQRQQQLAPAPQQAPASSGSQDGNASYPPPSIDPYPAPETQGEALGGAATAPTTRARAGLTNEDPSTRQALFNQEPERETRLRHRSFPFGRVGG